MKPLVSSLNLQVKGVSFRVRLASMMVLALELDYLRRKMGYAGPGSWQAYRDDVQAGSRPTWEAFCVQQAGITDATFRNHMKCVVVVIAKLKRSPSAGEFRLAELMQRQPSLLTENERSGMIEAIATHALREGDGMSNLRNARLSNDTLLDDRGDKIEVGAADLKSIVAKAREIEALALAAGVKKENAAEVTEIIMGPEFRKRLVRLYAAHLKRFPDGKNQRPPTQ